MVKQADLEICYAQGVQAALEKTAFNLPKPSLRVSGNPGIFKEMSGMSEEDYKRALIANSRAKSYTTSMLGSAIPGAIGGGLLGLAHGAGAGGGMNLLTSGLTGAGIGGGLTAGLGGARTYLQRKNVEGLTPEAIRGQQDLLRKMLAGTNQ